MNTLFAIFLPSFKIRELLFSLEFDLCVIESFESDIYFESCGYLIEGDDIFSINIAILFTIACELENAIFQQFH